MSGGRLKEEREKQRRKEGKGEMATLHGFISAEARGVHAPTVSSQAVKLARGPILVSSMVHLISMRLNNLLKFRLFS